MKHELRRPSPSVGTLTSYRESMTPLLRLAYSSRNSTSASPMRPASPETRLGSLARNLEVLARLDLDDIAYLERTVKVLIEDARRRHRT